MTLDRSTLRQALAAVVTYVPGPWFFAYNRILSGPVNTEFMRIERSWGADDLADDDPRWNDLPDADVCRVETIAGDTASLRGVVIATYLVEASPDVVEGLLAEAARGAALQAAVTEYFAARAEAVSCRMMDPYTFAPITQRFKAADQRLRELAA